MSHSSHKISHSIRLHYITLVDREFYLNSKMLMFTHPLVSTLNIGDFINRITIPTEHTYQVALEANHS